MDFDWMLDNAWVIWTGIAVVLILAELASMALVLLMFGIGAAVTAVAASMGLPLPWCLAIFGVVSIGLLTLVRPRIVTKFVGSNSLSAGQHGLVGSHGIVDELVTPTSGRITIEGQLWTARPADNASTFPVGSRVQIAKIDGAIARITQAT